MQIPITIKNIGGIADDHLIRAADQAEMIGGLQRAISYTILSLVEDRLVERVTKKSLVQVLSKAPYSGSIIHSLVVQINADPDLFIANAFTGVATGVIGNYITKFMEVVFKQGSGLLTDTEYDISTKQFLRQEPYFDDLVNKTEPHIASIHAPINNDEKIIIKIGNSSEIHLDLETKDYTSASNWPENPIGINGFVSRLNLLTGNGRIYSHQHNRVLSFSQTEPFRLSTQSELLSWSLRQKDTNMESDINVLAFPVTSNSGRIKRLWINGITNR